MGTETKVGLPELLWATLDIYRDHGGAKGTMRDYRTGQLCLVGALAEAGRRVGYVNLPLGLLDEAETELTLTAQELFPRPYHLKWMGAYNFNDNLDTTKEMVETVIEKSAIKASEVVE